MTEPTNAAPAPAGAGSAEVDDHTHPHQQIVKSYEYTDDTITVYAYDGDRLVWEWSIANHSYVSGKPNLVVEILFGALDAVADCQDLFGDLRTVRPPVLADVPPILDRHGYTNTTSRAEGELS